MPAQESQGEEQARVPMSAEEIEAATVGAVPRLDGQVTLRAYDPRWAEAFAREAAAIREALGGVRHEIEHAGSTSVPGLVAKPIVDMVLTLPDPADETAYVPALERAGFRLAIREPEWFEHRVLRKQDLGPGTDSANLHVFPSGCPEVTRMLSFRDWLRAHPDDRDLYARTKQQLAARTWAFTQNYADAKSDVVAEILERAARGS
ncbi:GrpB family protein [Streptomyces spectabilis]|uniref:GrpB family protein n=1 Tax=Streptomyces spectabilis TaxID=68270 RepID=A0A516RJD1_STRST|nr:GrpB family protein [Streptomyces spectabilis]QDQ15759.1 GrpB family protein [Streptomyces spectabilis]